MNKSILVMYNTPFIIFFIKRKGYNCLCITMFEISNRHMGTIKGFFSPNMEAFLQMNNQYQSILMVFGQYISSSRIGNCHYS